MATSYKTFLNNDKTTTRTLLHEAIPITGTLVSGTYLSAGSEMNIKSYGHGMFQSVYDYPYLSSSANHIFDITAGYSGVTNAGTSYKSALSSSSNTQNAKKINIYSQLCQQLVGYNTASYVRPFDRDGDLSAGMKFKEVVALSFSRLLVKDEIKKVSFPMNIATGSNDHAAHASITISDTNGDTSYKVNSPAGEYGLLYTGSVGTGASNNSVGLIYYQAGIVVLTASVFNTRVGNLGSYAYAANSFFTGSLSNADNNIRRALQIGTIDGVANGCRNRIKYISFNNTTELNSTIYFCRAAHNEFNYSANPTYVTGSKIRVKENTLDQPVSYITTVGMYSADNELLAVAKLSEPLKKTPDNELTLRVRLDY